MSQLVELTLASQNKLEQTLSELNKTIKVRPLHSQVVQPHIVRDVPPVVLPVTPIVEPPVAPPDPVVAETVLGILSKPPPKSQKPALDWMLDGAEDSGGLYIQRILGGDTSLSTSVMLTKVTEAGIKANHAGMGRLLKGIRDGKYESYIEEYLGTRGVSAKKTDTGDGWIIQKTD